MGNFAENLNLGNRFRPPLKKKQQQQQRRLRQTSANYGIRLFQAEDTLSWKLK